jgi:CheY-like chemotaxis protein
VLLAVDGVEAVELARREPARPHPHGRHDAHGGRPGGHPPAPGFPKPDIPIITLTALDQAREKALEAGANDFLAKPINSRILFSKVKTWLAA